MASSGASSGVPVVVGMLSSSSRASPSPSPGQHPSPGQPGQHIVLPASAFSQRHMMSGGRPPALNAAAACSMQPGAVENELDLGRVQGALNRINSSSLSSAVESASACACGGIQASDASPPPHEPQGNHHHHNNFGEVPTMMLIEEEEEEEEEEPVGSHNVPQQLVATTATTSQQQPRRQHPQQRQPPQPSQYAATPSQQKNNYTAPHCDEHKQTAFQIACTKPSRQACRSSTTKRRAASRASHT